MARRMTFSAGAGLMAFIVLVLLVHETCSAKHSHLCPPSSCGHIHNISYPFRLQDDPENCGDPLGRYNLSCENNHTDTVLYLFARKYYVRQINYDNCTIRVVDSGTQEDNSSFLPPYFLNHNNFSFLESYTLYERKRRRPYGQYMYHDLAKSVVFWICEKPVNSPLYLDTSTCFNNGIQYSSNHSKRYTYVKVGRTNASEVESSCQVKRMFLTSWPAGNDEANNISCTDLRNEFVYGFELSWIQVKCESCGKHESCFIDEANHVRCYGGLLGFQNLARFILNVFISGSTLIGMYHALITILGSPCVVALLIYKWRRRHVSMYDAVEEFLQTQNNFMPIRYSYSEIKKMTKSFKDKLGEGGYGTVYKGILRSGQPIAIKMLGKSKTKGQDFISEVATIGRIHHVNVVQLIGFCVQGSKQALIYEFMPNGSLNKHIFSQEETFLLSYKKIYDIAIGVARGIEYLHRGCDMQILHFDIKPHNILLDENFTPKVSDFGLAKLYPVDNSIVSLTAARGTLGYMAPELFYKNIGGVSYKADVYSFGMLLMEMASRRKNLNAFAEQSSQIYFPTWVYDQLHDGKDIEIEEATEEEQKVVKKMIIVALWCIQMKPSDRPSMNKVVEMLEGEVEYLQMPHKPFLSSVETPKVDGEENLNQTYSSIQSDEER